MKPTHAPMRLRVEHYAIQFTQRALYSDIDGYRHLNNVAISRFLEEGRADMNHRVFGVEVLVAPEGEVQLLFASILINYLNQGYYPGVVEVATAVNKIGRSSVEVVQGLFQDGKCIALSESTMVKVVGQSPTALSEIEKEGLDKLLFANAAMTK